MINLASAGLVAAPESRRWVLRGHAVAMAAAGAAFGSPLPTRAGEVAQAASSIADTARAALWLGPDEVWFITPVEDGAALEGALRTALAAVPHALVDISHRQVGLLLQGTDPAWLLNAVCPLDLSLAAFPVNCCTRTLFNKAEIVLWRTGPAAFRLETGRSFSGYVVGLLAEIAREQAA